MDNEKRTGFTFTDLSLTEGNEIDGMAAGEFIDMWGRITTIDKLEEYVSNTTENLEATRTEAGELVGLPIDAQGHDNGDGAGWITGVRQEGDIVRFSVKWTEIGRELIEKGIRRFFSPTISTENRVILGGSLTNWPATRTRKGKILLRPIALSEQIMEAEYEEPPIAHILQGIRDFLTSRFAGAPDKKDAQKDSPEELRAMENEISPEKVAELRAAWLAELSSEPPADLTALVEGEVNRRLTAQLEAEQRKQHIAEFSARVVGGSDDKPIGLPVAKDKLEAFLSGLTPEQQTEAEAILADIHDKAAVDYSEHGHSKQLQGQSELPDWAKPMLKGWVEKGKTIEAFFSANKTELGDQTSYNLTEFIKE